MNLRNFLTFTLMSAFALLLFSCGGSKPAENTETETTPPVEEEVAPKITLTKAPPSPEFADASLSLTSSDVQAGEASGFVGNMAFTVGNYELGAQTEDAATRGIANSGKGQHIHFILNNGPYSAHYEPNFTKEFTEAGNYVMLAFLSRSYHESVKNPNAFQVGVVKVGEPEGESDFDAEAQHLFYSRPKGTYKGADTEKLMLDFYLLNNTLSPSGNKVRATINGNEFMIDEWAPYYIEGLPKGEITVKLELLDAEGNVISGPFNTVERKVMLEE